MGFDFVEFQLYVVFGGSVFEQNEISLQGYVMEVCFYVEDL